MIPFDSLNACLNQILWLISIQMKATKYTALLTFASASTYYYHVSQRESKDKLTIVWDLDQTLMNSHRLSTYGNFNNRNVSDPHHTIRDESTGYHIWYRPFASVVLAFLSPLFNMHVFTAATKEYADPVLEKLPDVFQIRLYRESWDNVGKDVLKITKHYPPGSKATIAVLVDDQLKNNVAGQQLYHMPVYTKYSKFDTEMLRFAAWAVWWNVKNDLQ